LKTHLFSAYQHVSRITGVSRNALYNVRYLLTYFTYLLRRAGERNFRDEAVLDVWHQFVE